MTTDSREVSGDRTKGDWSSPNNLGEEESTRGNTNDSVSNDSQGERGTKSAIELEKPSTAIGDTPSKKQEGNDEHKNVT